MKTDFTINVHVNLGVTPEFNDLIHSILVCCSRPSIPADTKPLTNTTPIVHTPSEGAEAKPEVKPEAKPKEKKYTTEDVRKAMHETRVRIEGEDYLTNKESEAYKKFHRQLTAQFKNIAQTLGSDKPSELPEENIPNFIKSVAELYADGDTIATKLPF